MRLRKWVVMVVSVVCALHQVAAQVQGVYSTRKDALVKATFTAPDTVCVNTPVKITNTSVGGTNYYWNFNVADINQTPIGDNLGNIGNLSSPVFIDYVEDNGKYYGFLVNYHLGSLVRLDFGTSLLNTPTTYNFGNFGGIIPPGDGAEGVQIVKNEGKWYAIIVGGWEVSGSTPRVLKIDFGANITNSSPVATNWGNIGNMSQPIDLHVFQDADNSWYGFTVNAENNTITRFNFTSSFENTPTALNLGNVGDLKYPTGIYAINNNNKWHVFVVNAGDNTRENGPFSLTRLDFGSSLLNTPTGVNLGSLNGTLQHPRDLTILKFCDKIIGFAVNGKVGTSDIVRFDFHNDLLSTPDAVSLGNIGNLNFPHSISKLFRVGADLYSFITNVANNTITRIRFAGSNNSSIPTSTLKDPPTITYSQPGVYNVNLLMDEGLPTQTTYCKSVVVVPPLKAPTLDTSLCNGDSLLITSNFNSGNVWNTGSTNNSIYIKTSGTYWVQGNYYGCAVRDSIKATIGVAPTVFLGRDTAICKSQSLLLNAGNPGGIYNWQDGTKSQTFVVKSPGIYHVDVSVQGGCIGRDTIKISQLPNPTISKLIDTSICAGSSVVLNAASPANDLYSWAPATGLASPNNATTIASPTSTTTYYLTAISKTTNCSISDTVVITVVPKPTVSTINDTAICEKTSVVLTTKTTGANTISWSPSQGLSSNATASPAASPLANTTYTITAANGTCTVQDNVTITLKPAPVAVVSPNATICNTQQLQLNASGGVSYQWQPSSGLSDANSANPIAKPNTTTKYFVFVTGNNNCVSKDSVSVTVNPYPQFSVSPAQSNVCVGNNISITAAGGDTYTWYDNNGLYSSGSASIQPQPATSTRYKAVIVNTACNIVDSVFSNITVSPEMVTTLSKSNDVDCTIGQAQLSATGAAKYQWYPADHVSNPNIANPLVTPGQTTMYHVKMTSVDGCEKIDSIEVKVTGGSTETGYLVSSAFTPNGDGINDCFGVKKWGFVTDLEFSIFSRWGERVFYTKDASRCWDGSFKNNPQPAGAYIYLIKAKTFCGTVLRRGTVVLIR